LSENFGSCITIDMRAPRSARRSRGGMVGKSIPAKRSRSAVTSPGGAMRRRGEEGVFHLRRFFTLPD
jgi:hypothetical protein